MEDLSTRLEKVSFLFLNSAILVILFSRFWENNEKKWKKWKESFANYPVLAGHETATESGTGDHNLNMLHMRMELLKSTRLKIYCCKSLFSSKIQSLPRRIYSIWKITQFQILLNFNLKTLSLITSDSH